jgi:hypothetical protein
MIWARQADKAQDILYAGTQNRYFCNLTEFLLLTPDLCACLFNNMIAWGDSQGNLLLKMLMGNHLPVRGSLEIVQDCTMLLQLHKQR